MVQNMSSVGMTPYSKIYNNQKNFGNNLNNQSFGSFSLKSDTPQEIQSENKSKVSTFFKSAIKTLSVVGGIVGILVFANKKGFISKVENPATLWDKVQNKLAQSGDKIEKETLLWYKRTKKFSDEKKTSEERTKNVSLNKIV